MKNIKTFRLLTLLFLLVTFNSCVEDDDYSIPTSIGLEENDPFLNFIFFLHKVMPELLLTTMTSLSSVVYRLERCSCRIFQVLLRSWFPNLI